MIRDWTRGQRVYYHYPTMSRHRCYGNIIDWGQTHNRVWFVIKFDGLGNHHYENKPGIILIHPADEPFKSKEPEWEL